MTTVHMSPAEARTTRKAAPREKGTTSTCTACSKTFTTIAAEDRHLAATGHARYATSVEVAG
jgi:hypothetical protein